MKRYIILQLIFLVLVVGFVSCEKDEVEKVYGPALIMNIPARVNLADTLKLIPEFDSIFIPNDVDVSFEYTWKLNNNIVSTEKDYNFLPPRLGEYNLTFSASNETGNFSTTQNVIVFNLIDFEELPLADSSSYKGENGSFVSKEMLFPNEYTSNDDWSGFGYTNRYSPDSLSIIDIGNRGDDAEFKEYEMNILAKDTLFETEISGIYKLDSNQDTITLLAFENDQEFIIESMYLANTALGFLSMKYGYNAVRMFGGNPEEGSSYQHGNAEDQFIVNIDAFNATGDLVGSKKLTLADYSFYIPSNDEIKYLWNFVNLKSLGPINKLRLKITSTLKDESNEIVHPAYIAIDNISYIKPTN